MSFTKKRIRIKLTLATGNFGSTQSNTLTLEGLRTIVEVRNVSTIAPEANVKIYGMKQSDMNQLSVMSWRTLGVQNNVVEISAGDDVSGMKVVFRGTMIKAFGNYQSAPDVFFYIEAQSGYFYQIDDQTATPHSFPKEFDIAAFLGQLAKEMQLTFENNCGVVMHPSHPFKGSLMYQAQEAVQIANLNMYIDADVLAITPQYTPRQGVVPTLNAQSGLVGYPTLNTTGIEFKCLFNPDITFGGQIKIGEISDSNSTAQTNADLQKQDPTRNPVKGNWTVCNLTLQLESEIPDGAWFSHVACTEVGYGSVVK